MIQCSVAGMTTEPPILDWPMIKNTLLRYLLGIVLGGLAGLSFCVSILPIVLEMAGAREQSYTATILSQYALYSAMIWAAGGYAVARAGFMKAALVILPIVGLSSGVLLVFRGIRPDPAFLVAGALGGLVYGLVGGMLLGRALSRPPAN